jgi:hypothetical protein
MAIGRKAGLNTKQVWVADNAHHQARDAAALQLVSPSLFLFTVLFLLIN